VFEEQYCKKHAVTYHLPGICPECAEDRIKEQAARESKDQKPSIWDNVIWPEGKDPFKRN
jgi:hypothetical protein